MFLVDPVPHPNTTIWWEFAPDYLDRSLCNKELYHLAYTPNTTNTTELVQWTARSLNVYLSRMCCSNENDVCPDMMQV